MRGCRRFSADSSASAGCPNRCGRSSNPKDGPAKVGGSDAGVQLDLALNHVDPRFRRDLSLRYKMTLPDDVLAALPFWSLAFGVSPDYVFHLLSVRVRT